MALLKRAEILESKDLETREVEVPEWGGSVLVRGMTGTERDDLEGSIVTQNGKKTSVNTHNLRARICALCMVDEDGERLFNDADIKALGAKSAAALQRVFEAAQQLSGLSNEDLEELEKNSKAGVNGGSISV